MPGLGRIDRDRIGRGESPVEILGSATLEGADPPERVAEKGRVRTAVGARADFFVVQEAGHLSMLRRFHVRESVENGEAAEKIVEAARVDELALFAEDARALGVDEEQIGTEDGLGLDVQFARHKAQYP